MLKSTKSNVFGGLCPRIILAGFLLLIPTARVHAFEGAITIAGDPSTALCTVTDTAVGTKTFYVVHTFNAGTIASRFKVEAGPGVTMTYVSESHYFPMTIGDTQSGISSCYGSCTTNNQVIASIVYATYGTSSNCSKMLVVPHPDAETVDAIRCDGVAVATFVQDMFVRSSGPCGCPNAHGFSGTPHVFSCQPVTLASSTWGAIKALYR